MQWAWLLVCLVHIHHGFAHEHFHEISKRVFSMEPSKPDANFGFSISSVHSGPKSKLVVGAPLADLTGRIYTCDLTKNDINDCQNTNNHGIKRYVDKPQYGNLSYWFGATVQGTDKDFVGCAPLTLDKDSTIITGYPVGTYGRCYKDRDDGKGPVPLKTISPSQRKDYKYANYSKFEDTTDSFGWSLSIDSSGSILIGSPAVVRGRLMKLKGNKVVFMDGAHSNRSLYNFGYSVTSGVFYSTYNNIQQIAAGSTYGPGEVAFLSEKGINMKKEKFVSGFSVGSMFGAVLCAAYLHTPRSKKPRISDLLVGAPTFADNDNYNIGAVYIYQGSADKETPRLIRRIIGTTSASYFGSAIISLGDLNGDNRDEIAIGAPYENEGRGTVYLYSGAQLAANGEVQPMQTLVPDAASFKTFGFSLAVVRDYDDNGCNELAIGAPESNKVMLLRCMAAITIKLNKFPQYLSATLGKDRTEQLPVCITVTFQDKPSQVNARIQVIVSVKHNDAKFSGSRNSVVVTIDVKRKAGSKTDTFCENVDLEISGTKGNYNKEIIYKFKASLQNSPFYKTDFQGSDVILSEHSVIELDGAMRVQECGARKCVPYLNMTTSFTEQSPYLIGSTPSINMTALVENFADVAYDACLRVQVEGASVPRLPDDCVANDDRTDLFECTPRQLLRKTTPWTLKDFSIDTTQLTNKDTQVSLTVELYDDCRANVSHTPFIWDFDLYFDATSVDVNGRTDEGLSDIVNLTRTDIGMQKIFEQIYTISNSGPTTWVNVNVIIEADKVDFVTRTVYVELNKCEPLSSSVSDVTSKFSCLVPKLAGHADIEAKVVLQVVTDKLDEIIDHELVQVSSHILVQLDETYTKNSTVTSVLRLVEGKVPIWIIIAASILALVILVIIFFILRECGFLKTENKNQLKRARMSVRRQTIMRQSMTNRPRSQDQTKLVDQSAIADQQNKNPKKDRRVVINDF